MSNSEETCLNIFKGETRNEDIIKVEFETALRELSSELLSEGTKELSDQVRRQGPPEGKDIELERLTKYLKAEIFGEIRIQFKLQEAVLDVNLGINRMTLGNCSIHTRVIQFRRNKVFIKFS